MYYRALKSAGVETEMVIYLTRGNLIRAITNQEDVDSCFGLVCQGIG